MPKTRAEIQHDYYMRNKEKCKAASAAWAAANPEKIKAKEHRYYAAHAKEIIARKAPTNRARYYANRDARLAQQRGYKKANPSKVNANNAVRRARKLQATPQWADLEAIKKIYEEAHAAGKHVDHAVPLKGRNVCGLHCEANLQILSPEENLRKGNRWQ